MVLESASHTSIMQSFFRFADKEKDNLDFLPETLEVINNWCFRLSQAGCDLVQFTSAGRCTGIIYARAGDYVIEISLELGQDGVIRIVASRMFGGDKWSYECKAGALLHHFDFIRSRAGFPF